MALIEKSETDRRAHGCSVLCTVHPEPEAPSRSHQHWRGTRSARRSVDGSLLSPSAPPGLHLHPLHEAPPRARGAQHHTPDEPPVPSAAQVSDAHPQNLCSLPGQNVLFLCFPSFKKEFRFFSFVRINTTITSCSLTTMFNIIILYKNLSVFLNVDCIAIFTSLDLSVFHSYLTTGSNLLHDRLKSSQSIASVLQISNWKYYWITVAFPFIE